MAYIENPFRVGQKVVCISDDFPRISEYGGVESEATSKPKKGEELIIDEILGEFLRFEKYDSPESFNWWKHTRFAPLTELTAFQYQELLQQNSTWND